MWTEAETEDLDKNEDNSFDDDDDDDDDVNRRFMDFSVKKTQNHEEGASLSEGFLVSWNAKAIP
jgi:hypothetical protein